MPPPRTPPFDNDMTHRTPGVPKDLETRAMAVSQLVREVKGICAGVGKWHLPTVAFRVQMYER